MMNQSRPITAVNSTTDTLYFHEKLQQSLSGLKFLEDDNYPSPQPHMQPKVDSDHECANDWDTANVHVHYFEEENRRKDILTNLQDEQEQGCLVFNPYHKQPKANT